MVLHEYLQNHLLMVIEKHISVNIFFSLTKASVNHENFVIMGDFIFDISTTTAEADK